MHHIAASDFDSIMKEIHVSARQKRQPVNGTFELTERCNLACKFCYICHSPYDKYRKVKELTTYEWLEIARESVDNGMVFLLLTGGEVFLREDFFEIYTPLTRLGIIITLYSNGTLFNEAIANRLVDFPPRLVSISIYGATSNSYKVITGNAEAYNHFCKGVEVLLKHDITIELKAIISRDNVHEVISMEQMAQNWGLHLSKGFYLTQRRDRAVSKVKECRLSASDCVKLENINNEAAKIWDIEVMRKKALRNDSLFNCNAGQAAFVINSKGEMNACVDLPFPCSDVRALGFNEAWKQVQDFVDFAPSMSKVCFSCDARVYCTRCPAWSYLETGNLCDPVPYLCEIAHERKIHYK